jgi:hypothetical protein
MVENIKSSLGKTVLEESLSVSEWPGGLNNYIWVID